MRKWREQRGAGLILLIGITAALAILTSSLVMLIANQQGATARERQSKTSMYYAEAALNSALAAVKQSDAWRSDPALDPGPLAVLTAALGTNFDTLPAPRPAVTYRIYDDAATITASTPGWDQNNDAKVWVQVTTTYQGRTSSVRQMVAATTTTWTARLPKAAAFCGGAGASDNITMSGSADAYMASYAAWPATYTNGTPYIGGAPFPTSIMAKGSITGASGSDLAQGTGKSKPQSVGVIYGTSRSFPLLGTSLQSSQGSVPDLNTYLSLADQVGLEQEARSITDTEWQTLLSSAKVDARPVDARPTDQRPAAVSAPAYTSKTALLAACAYDAGTNTYTASTDMYYNSNTALAFSDGATYKFRSLTVKGNLTVSGTTTFIATSLRANGTLGITSTGTTNRLGVDASGAVVGSVYAIGNTTVGGSSTNKFGPLWTDGSLTLSGTGATSATTLHVGSSGMSISSTTGVNTIGRAYVVGGLTTTSACTSSNQFAELWVDGSVSLGGTGNAGTSITTLHAGVDLAINSLTGTNMIGPAYVVRNFSTAAASTSPNQFQDLWVDGTATLSGSGATTSSSLHVGGALSINNTTAITNSLGSTWVVGAFNTASACKSTNQFGALWVDGSVTLNGTTTTNASALHVGGDFAISGPTSTNTFGPIYVIGDVNWGGTASVKTTDYVDTAALPAPMWVGGVFTRNGGPYNDEYGDTFVVFQVNFASAGGSSTVMCPLFATTEMITTSNNINFGTMVTDLAHPHPRPMTLYMVCDNDGFYTQTCNWGSTGQFYGLMILFEAGITLQNGCASGPAVVGSVLTIGGDNGLLLNNSAQIAYCQDVVDWVFFPTVSTSTVTQTVPGTWQELSPSGQ